MWKTLCDGQKTGKKADLNFFIYWLLFWSWETKSMTNIGKISLNTDRNRAEREKSHRTKKIIQVSASGGENTFLEAEHKPGNYTSVYAEAAVSSEGLNQLHLHRWDAEGLTDVWGIWTKQGGSDTKQPGGFCNAHASPAQLGRAVLVIFLNIPACVIYHLYSCNPFQNTQEISM